MTDSGSRAAFSIAYTLDSAGMIMNLPEVGSQNLIGLLDADGNPYDGSGTCKVMRPKDTPAKAFWSVTLNDNQTRSMLQVPQKCRRSGIQSYLTPAATAVLYRISSTSPGN